MRVAAIDVGSNSVHLLVADVGAEGEIALVEKDRVQVELGRGGLDHHVLTDAAIERGIDALRSFRQTMTSLGVEAVEAAATSAVREAKNGGDFVRAASEATDIHIRVISGVEEARLIYLGVRPDLDFSRGYALILDVGGGSVELILCDATRILAAHSVPLGHLRMAGAHIHHDPPLADEIAAIRRQTRTELRRILGDIPPGVSANLVGTGGSVRSLARMATLARGNPEPQHGHGLVLERGDLKRLRGQFTQLPQARLTEIPGMDARRRRTLPAAAAVVYQVMKTFDHGDLVTSDRSLRDGLLAHWVLRNEPELALARTVAWPRMRAVIRLVDRYGGDRRHCERVRDLALALFDGLGGLKLDPSARRTLEFAALLHDIGHHVHPRDHHKHGQYLILNSRMGGFTAPEVAVLANIVRYHRGRPRRSHRHFRSLSGGQQRQVQILSAILRLADAMDRSHTQPIVDVWVEDDGNTVTVHAITKEEAHIERWAAERRSSRLSNVLGRPVTVVIEPVAADGQLAPNEPPRVE